jgi:hypothetical protein
MLLGILKQFFNTPVIIVVHGHMMEGILTEPPQLPTNTLGVVGLTSLPASYDGYAQATTAIVEVSSIDVIRPLTVVVG